MKIREGSCFLPFVKYEGGEICYWCPQPETGDWATDNSIGRQYADDLYAGLPAKRIGTVFVHVSEAIIRSGRIEGIEVGFFNRIGEILGDAKERLQTQPIQKAA